MSDIVNSLVASDFKKVLVNFEKALLKRIEEYRWTQRIESRADAIRILLEDALDRAESPDGTKGQKPTRGTKSDS
jgi:metal-responsive CopG/Arc/MetJ family transcriptional regulator